MERGENSNQQLNGLANGETNTNNGGAREQDQYVTVSNIVRIMRKILPPNVKIADDAKETVQECVSEYIGFITSEANDRCRSDQRKTVTAEDILSAMHKLGFDNYVDTLTAYLNRYRHHESRRTTVPGEPIVRRTVDYAQSPVPANGYVFRVPTGLGVLNPAVGTNRNPLQDAPRARARAHAHAATSSSSYPRPLPRFDPYAHFK